MRFTKIIPAVVCHPDVSGASGYHGHLVVAKGSTWHSTKHTSVSASASSCRAGDRLDFSLMLPNK